MNGNLRITVAGALAVMLASLALFPAFDRAAWLWPGIGLTLLIAAVGFGLRQLNTPRLLIPIGQLAITGWVFILFTASEELRWGFLPTGESVAVLSERIGDGLAIIVRYAAPVPHNAQLALVTVLGIGLVAIIVDSIAATFRMVPWAGLPLLLLYSIPSTTVRGGLSALAFVPAATGYIILLVSEGRDRLSRWGRVIGFAEDTMGPAQGVQTSMLGQTGRRVGAAVIGIAVLVPALLPNLPEGILTSGTGVGGSGGGGRTVQVGNPMVDLRRDLRMPENVVLFEYRPDKRAVDYIKMVTLDEFDGEAWRPSERSVSPLEGGGQLPSPPGLDEQAQTERLTTEFSITSNLRSEWLPLFFPARRVDVPGNWSYDPQSLDLVSSEPDTNASGLTYTAVSLSPQFEGEQLRKVEQAPRGLRNRYTQLPGTVPDAIHELALQVTEGAKTDFDKASALQAWFRGEFRYSLQVVPGHSEQALMDFLEDRSGYCEQFAATMAIMARSLGIPARVAVGYQRGSPIGDDRWEVRVRDAHAWPELYFSGYGWVRFEPTPVSRTGSPPSWTTITESRDPSNPGTDPQTTPGQAPQPQPTDPALDPSLQEIGGAGTSGGDGGGPLPFDPMYAGLAGGFLLLLAVPGVARVLIRRARLRRSGPDRLADSCWQELADTAEDLGLEWNDSATPRNTAGRLGERMDDDARAALITLTAAVEQSRYAWNPRIGGDLRAATRTVLRALRRRTTVRRRAWAKLLPRTFWRPFGRLGTLGRPLAWLLDGVESIGGRIVARFRPRRQEP